MNESIKPLVLCADDYAASATVSEAVCALAEAGRLTATSAMVLAPRWAEDARRLAALRGRLDVGLHLDVTSAFARAAGHGMSLPKAMLRALAGGFDQGAARAEIERQLDAFEAAWGAPPDHIDGHQHVQQFAGIRQALIEVVARRYPARPPWLRLSRAVGAIDLKSWLIAALGADAIESAALSARIPLSPALSGIYGFDSDAPAYGRRMARWLREAPAGTLLMCHPATRAEPGDEIGAARASEFAYLASDAFWAVLVSEKVQLARGSTLYTAAP